MKTKVFRRVMNYQTDSLGVVHHARYLEIMEEARWRYFDDNNLMETFHQNGIFHMIVNVQIDYRNRCRFGDLISVSTEVFHVTEQSVVFRHTVTRGDCLVATGDITNVFMNKSDNGVIKVGDLAGIWQDLNAG